MILVQRGTRVMYNMDQTAVIEFPTTGLDIEDHEYAAARISQFLVKAGELAEGELSPVRFVSSYQGMVSFAEAPTDPVISEH
jgi:hypothetical protein